MNKLLLTFMALMLSFGATAQTRADKLKNEPEILLMETEYNFGNIEQGEIVEHDFFFENVGTKPLIISDVITNCKCIEVVLPEKQVTKGKAAILKLRFNSSGEFGLQNKFITIVSNAINAEERIILKAVVLPESESR